MSLRLSCLYIHYFLLTKIALITKAGNFNLRTIILHSNHLSGKLQEFNGLYQQISDIFHGYVKKKYLICIIK